MAISKLNLPYPAVQNYDVMDDYIFNDNNAFITNKINEIINIVNAFEYESIGYEIKPLNIGTDWIGADAPYTQKVNLVGIDEDTLAFMLLNPSPTLSIAKDQLSAYSNVNIAKPENGRIEFICLYGKPNITIPTYVVIIKKEVA